MTSLVVLALSSDLSGHALEAEFSVPLSGGYKALHTWDTESNWQDTGIPSLIVSAIEGANPLEHFNSVLTAHGLTRLSDD
jgi:hypothetical protein